MKRNRLLYLALLALTALAVACTAEETFTGRDVQADSPSDCLAEGVYTYNLHFDLLGMTRAAGIWADGSQVEFFFYTEVGQTGYKGISGTATYNASGQSWTLTTSTKLPASPASTDCEARYYKPGSDPSNEFLTAVYYATGSYVCQGDTDVYADVTLKPCNWRLRFKGTAGTQLTFTATNIRHCTGDSLHAVNAPQATTATVPLTVATDGYTSYIYGTLGNASTLTLTAGEEQYTRTLTLMEAGKSFALDIPQKSDYGAKGWTLIEDPHTTATTTPLTFAATPAEPQTIAVTSNEDWTATSSAPEWCSVSPGTSTNSGTVTVTATENTSTTTRTATITVKGLTSGDETRISVTQAAAEKKDNAPAGAEAVDLGLPSGVKWANMNVGASRPEDYGDYFAWGETVGYTSDTNDGRLFNWASYKWMTEGQSSWQWVNKYQVADNQTSGCWYTNGTFTGDGLSTLLPEDDAATQNWGTNWRMPTFAEIQELLNNTTYTWTRHNGVKGGLFTSNKNGNSIFIPAAGYRSIASLSNQGTNGNVWSSSVYPSSSDGARGLYFHSGDRGWSDGYRSRGRSVRPVTEL